MQQVDNIEQECKNNKKRIRMRNRRTVPQSHSGVRAVVKKSKGKTGEHQTEESVTINLRYFDPEDLERIQAIALRLSNKYRAEKPNFFYSTLLAAKDLLTK